VRRTRRFARRQQRWFGRDPRIEWVTVDLSAALDENALARIEAVLER
jgi:tRNA dimethylallyltransferase